MRLRSEHDQRKRDDDIVPLLQVNSRSIPETVRSATSPGARWPRPPSYAHPPCPSWRTGQSIGPGRLSDIAHAMNRVSSDGSQACCERAMTDARLHSRNAGVSTELRCSGGCRMGYHGRCPASDTGRCGWWGTAGNALAPIRVLIHRGALVLEWTPGKGRGSLSLGAGMSRQDVRRMGSWRLR